MNRSFLLAAPIAAGLLLSNCATVTPTSVTDTIQKVQQTAVAVCGFLPTAATVASILSGGNPLVSTVDAIAQAICAAVAPTQGLRGKRRGAAVPMVGDVVVHGKFIR